MDISTNEMWGWYIDNLLLLTEYAEGHLGYNNG